MPTSLLYRRELVKQCSRLAITTGGSTIVRTTCLEGSQWNAATNVVYRDPEGVVHMRLCSQCMVTKDKSNDNVLENTIKGHWCLFLTAPTSECYDLSKYCVAIINLRFFRKTSCATAHGRKCPDVVHSY